MTEQSIEYRDHRIYIAWRGRFWTLRYVRLQKTWMGMTTSLKEYPGLKLGGRWPNKELAIGMLNAMHHWQATAVNRGEKRHGYLVRITHMGRRVAAQRKTFVAATQTAFDNLTEQLRADHAREAGPKLRLVD